VTRSEGSTGTCVWKPEMWSLYVQRKLTVKIVVYSKFSFRERGIKAVFFIGKFWAPLCENSAISLREWPESCDLKVHDFWATIPRFRCGHCRFFSAGIFWALCMRIPRFRCGNGWSHVILKYRDFWVGNHSAISLRPLPVCVAVFGSSKL